MIESLVAVGYKELKKNGVFVLPGFAKFVVVKKPARLAREGRIVRMKRPTPMAAS